MKAKSMTEAWKIADELFPTDYMKDEAASERAGYPIYASTAEGVTAWISDLNTSLEVNQPNGETIRIWIEDEPEENTVCGFHVSPIYTPSPAIVVSLTVYGGMLAENEAEQKVYDDLKNGSTHAAFPVLEQYAANAGIKWGAMKIASVTHYNHGKPGSGHFVIEGIIKPTVTDPLAFLPICSKLLAEQYKETVER